MSRVLDQLSLEGKVAIVTGSGRGLGKAMAMALADAGADLVVTSRTESEIREAAQEIRELGRKVLAVAADIWNSPARKGGRAPGVVRPVNLVRSARLWPLPARQGPARGCANTVHVFQATTAIRVHNEWSTLA